MRVVLLCALLLGGCERGRWVWAEDRPVIAPVVAECPGGRVNVEKRTVDVGVVGRTRNTTVRTDACLN